MLAIGAGERVQERNRPLLGRGLLANPTTPQQKQRRRNENPEMLSSYVLLDRIFLFFRLPERKVSMVTTNRRVMNPSGFSTSTRIRTAP